jgi:hypothetical protein
MSQAGHTDAAMALVVYAKVMERKRDASLGNEKAPSPGLI